MLTGWMLMAAVATPSPAQSARWIAPRLPDAGATAPPPMWLWVAQSGAPPPSTANAPAGPAWFFRDFDVGGAGAEIPARLAVAADNHAVVWLNGAQVLRSDSWSQPALADVVLRPGRNTLAIRAENDAGAGANPAGVVVMLMGSDEGANRGPRVVSDGGWLAAASEWANWPEAPPPGAAAPAAVLGPCNTPPWNLSPGAFVPEPPCPILRSEFDIDGEPARAIVRVVGLGHFELRLNGRRVGDTLIDQAWSQYDKTLYSQEFDVTPLLRRGRNAWGMLLGNSFWRVGTPNATDRFAKTDAMPDFSNGLRHLLRLELSVQLADGRRVVLGSDGAWKWIDGPLTFSHIYAGEDYDARLWPRGWDEPGFDDGAWRAVHAVGAPAAEVVPLPGPGLKAFEIFQPSDIREPSPGVFTYVFPQNCSALLRFTVSGPAGRTVRFKPCEYMDESGRVRFTYTWGTGKDIWHDYTLHGGQPESHQTLFCYVGCQYVEVTGAVPADRPNPAGLPVLERLELVHVRAANREVGEFSCSEEMQNAAHRLIDWSIRGNMSHVATDCPHREKNGWQEQNWHMARAIAYRYDVRDWYRKIMHDVRDTQLSDGHVPTNCPNYLVGVPPHGFWNEAPEWGVAAVLVPWHLYEWYGDRETLAQSFESMKRYVDYLSSQAREGVITSNLGDWYDYGHGKGDGPSRWTPTEVSATAIWALAAATTADAADVLDLPDDAAAHRALFETIRATFQRRFWDADAGMVRNNGSCQAANATALCVGLIPEADREKALQRIIDDLERRDWQQTTGEVLHIFFIRALAEAGRGDVLHEVYARTERGSYGFIVNNGLTTLPESWDAKPGTGNSMNHFMLGQMMEWHFAYVAGIRQPPGGVGWKRILIAPQSGELRSAEAAFDSPAGRIKSEWRRDGEVFELTANIPDGAVAEAVLPDGSRHELQAGRTVLSCVLKSGQ